MRPLSSLLGLPSALLLLLAAQVTDAQAGAQRLPTAIRMMGTDAGEKFLHEYSAFGSGDDDGGAASQAGAYAALLVSNASAAPTSPYRAPLAAHLYDPGTAPAPLVQARDDSHGGGGGGDDEHDGWGVFFRRARWAEARLARRDFACPTGSSDCAAIGYPNSCCQAGTTCVEITDTGLGAVGCCPDGQSCTGTIACSGGQEGCSSESGGGCCISGYACASVGCE